MSAKKKLRLVIDASILSGATEMQHPDSSNCRKFLESVRDNQHILVLTDEIIEEYKNNESKYSRLWRKSMVLRRQFENIKIDEKEKIKSKLSKFEFTEELEKRYFSKRDCQLMAEKHKENAIKDCLLIDAALKSDKIIASDDDKAKEAFSIVAVKTERLKTLIWVNPKKIAAELIVWLEGGKSDKMWLLYNSLISIIKNKSSA